MRVCVNTSGCLMISLTGEFPCVASKSRQFSPAADGADGIPAGEGDLHKIHLAARRRAVEKYTSVCAVEIRVTVNNNGLV